MTWFSPRRTRRARRNIIRALKGNLLFLLRVLRALRGLEIVQKYCKVSAIRDGPVVRSCLTFNCGEFAMDGLSLNLVATAAGRSGEPECGSSLPLDFARLAARGGAWEEPTGRPRPRWTAARSELRECERQRAAAVRGGTRAARKDNGPASRCILPSLPQAFLPEFVKPPERAATVTPFGRWAGMWKGLSRGRQIYRTP